MTTPNDTTEELDATEKTSLKQELQDSTDTLPVKRQLAILAVIMLLIFGNTQIPKALQSIDVDSDEVTASVPDTVVEKPVPKPDTTDYFAEISILAESAYVWDVQGQRALYRKNADEQLPLASVTKLMTALLAHELLQSDSEIPITVSAIKQDGNSGFSDGETFSLKKLLDLTLLSSSNDGAYAIATAVGAELSSDTEHAAETFVQAMNIKAEDLDLSQTYFRNPTGLDISETEGGAYGSARDVAFLMEHILTNYPHILEQTQEQFASIANSQGQEHSFENTNRAIDSLDGLIGSKTGYTELAGGNLVIAFDAAFNRPLIVVVLGSSRNGRFDDVLQLVDATHNTLTQ
ncbi:MAG: D-alanyl-D-alanine carboxypeptidase (penicillin-binding protein 5/6) [Candidatus Azotimanducaceae bacterium]|jgi:D-alanyl-D-alanine carboxypeptidase (penicillin-binding protein 5/6)